MAVSFSENVIVYEYYDSEYNNKKGIWETYALDNFRFQKRIKEFEKKFYKMNSVQQLLENRIKPGLSTIVYGNLGRRYKLLIYFLNLLFDSNTTIEIRTKNNDIETFCDVLVWFEPEFGETVSKPSYAKSFIVFTSHLNLNIPEAINIINFHLGDFTYNFEKLVNKKLDNVTEEENFKKDKKSEILDPNFKTYPEFKKDTNVIIQLSQCKNTNDAYLCLLKCFEALKYNDSYIESWRILFPSHKFLKHFKRDIEICREKLENFTLDSKSTTTNKKRLINMYLLLNKL